MFVRRSDVSLRDSIHLDSCGTGAKAMSSSDEGKAALSGFDLTKRSCGDAIGTPGSAGFHNVAGASVASIVIFFGPVRRSRYGAKFSRQVSAACFLSAEVIVTCIRLSAC